MGDCHSDSLRPQFDRRLRLEFHGASVTSDAGLLAYRELDDALQLTDTAANVLHDTRTGRNTRHGCASAEPHAWLRSGPSGSPAVLSPAGLPRYPARLTGQAPMPNPDGNRPASDRGYGPRGGVEG